MVLRFSSPTVLLAPAAANRLGGRQAVDGADQGRPDMKRTRSGGTADEMRGASG
jgi:hypothetical protein